MSGEVWEHLVLTFGTNNVAAMHEALNRYGSIGWETVGVAGVDRTVGTNGITVVMKRAAPAVRAPQERTAGWHTDPWRRAELRWWTGTHWSEQVVDTGSTPSVDWPIGSPPLG